MSIKKMNRRVSLSSILMVILSISTVIGSPIFIKQVPDEYDTCDAPAPSVAGTIGQAGIHNTCHFNVFVQSVAGQTLGPVVEVRSGTAYLENYHNGPAGGGVAIKVTKDVKNWSAPMLLEYTPNFDMDLVFYDVSVSVGGQGQGNGGIGNGYQLVPSVIDKERLCVPVTYSNSYIHLGEGDYATKSCPLSTSITLRLC